MLQGFITEDLTTLLAGIVKLVDVECIGRRIPSSQDQSSHTQTARWGNTKDLGGEESGSMNSLPRECSSYHPGDGISDEGQNSPDKSWKSQDCSVEMEPKGHQIRFSEVVYAKLPH
jgi:hypothetical protein